MLRRFHRLRKSLALRDRWRVWRLRRGRRVRTPTILQMEAVECGAAALGIVLAHHQRWVPLEELRLACGVSRDGSKASNVLRAARSFGLAGKGLRREPAALRALEPPFIVHWNFNHFVVVEGFDAKGRAFLNDPASGPRWISQEELDESFTGIVLTLKPSPDFEPGGAPPRLIPALEKRLRGSSSALAFILLAGLALVVPGLVVPVFSKVFVDNILLDQADTWLSPLLIAMAVAMLLTAALTWLQRSYLLRLETKMALGASSRFLWHVLRLPMEFFSQRFAGEISSRVVINDKVAQLLSGDLAANALSVVMIVFYAGVMFQYDPLLTLVGLVVVSLNVVALRFVSRRRIDGNRRLLQDRGKMVGTALGGLQIIETIKATGGENDLYQRWAGYQAKVVNTRQDLERYNQFLEAVPTILASLNTAIILCIGSLRVMDGALSLGALVAFQALMTAFTLPIHQLVNLGSKLQNAEADMNRLDDVLRYPPEVLEQIPDEPLDTSEPAKLSGRLELRAVSFGYSPLSPPLLDAFELRLEPGRRVALVGGSGSGKSTLARLVNGLYTPWQGDILFDGRPRESIPRSVINASLAAVDQSISLFEGTVHENLTLWDPTIARADVVAAAKDACIHEEIAARPGGYDSRVEEMGVNFSGGQRQRLEIARALVASPSLLVLDEATSALDPTTEQRIDENLRRRGCTCLIIAHRLSTIRDADEIIVLEGGKAVQRGSHDQLIAEVDGPYARLIGAE